MKYLMSAILVLASLSARAAFVVTDKGNVDKFTYENPQNLAPDAIAYSYKLVDFDKWEQNNSLEKKVLNLFAGFQQNPKKPLIMYIGKATTVMDIPVEKVNVAEFHNINAIVALDKMVKVEILEANHVITYSEQKFSYRNPPAPARWCDGPNVTCLTTTFLLPADNYLHLSAILQDKTKDSPYHDLHAQVEVRTFVGNEIANSADLNKLTGISTPPGLEAVQTSFWFTHAVEFAKNVVIFQPNPDPKRPNTTVATAFMAFGIDREKWKSSYNLMVTTVTGEQVMLGKVLGLNLLSGVVCGLPCFTQQTTRELIEALDK